MYSFKMSFCAVPRTCARGTPWLSATAKYMAMIGAATAFTVKETLIRSMGMPANAACMSARVSTAMPTRPTSSTARGSCESSPICVGKSKATFSAFWPSSIRKRKRWLVSSGVPKPAYWRMVKGRARYISG